MTQTTEATGRSPTQPEVLRNAIEYHTRDLWTAIPGKIDKWDPDKQMADVKPLVQDLVATEDGEEFVEPIPVIPNVPVRFPRAGGFYITMPVEEGDFCLLVFCARSIDKYLEGSGNDVDPGDFRTHDLTDAVAFMGVGPFSVAISDFEEKRIVIGKEGGNQVHVTDDKIELGGKDSPEKVPIDSKLQGELNKIATELSKINVALATNDTHTHNVTAVGSPTGPPMPLMAASISYSESPTESELVSIKE